MKLVVNGLPVPDINPEAARTFTQEDLRMLFTPFGEVTSAHLVTDQGVSRGFGFVDMADDQAAHAMQELDGSEFHGRTLRVLPSAKR